MNIVTLFRFLFTEEIEIVSAGWIAFLEFEFCHFLLGGWHANKQHKASDNELFSITWQDENDTAEEI